MKQVDTLFMEVDGSSYRISRIDDRKIPESASD